MSVYERELKGILQGNKKVLEDMTKSCDENIKKIFFQICEKPFIVIRAAGSFGIDLVAVREDFSFLIEVKASVESVFHFSDDKRLTEQVETLRKECSATGVIPLYAFRLKRMRGDPWRIFTLNIDNIRGRIKLFYDRIPKLEKTASGNYVMRWEHGMPLHRFIEYLC